MILGKLMDTKRKKTEKKSYPAALTIAGSDSGGGAGIQADLRTFNAYGVYGFSAVTAVTSQNPRTVSRIDAIPAAGVAGQISAVAGTLDVEYAKSGMLVSQDIVNVVAEAVEKYVDVLCDVEAFFVKKAFFKGCEFATSFLLETACRAYRAK